MPQKLQDAAKPRRYNTRGNSPALLGTLYPGRRVDRVVRNMTIDREADMILRQHAGEGKAMGAFVSRLLFEHQAREEERHKIARELLGAARG